MVGREARQGPGAQLAIADEGRGAQDVADGGQQLRVRLQAGGQATTKSIDYAFLRVYRTGIVKVGPSSSRLTTIPPRTNENYDTPPRLRSEVLDLLVQPDITQDAQLWIQSSDPTPLTVSSLTTKVTVGG